MSFQHGGTVSAAAKTCVYPGARLRSRGPLRETDRPFIAFLGGTETFGKFVPRPFPDLLEAEIDQTCINLGGLNVGLDAIAADTGLLRICRSATKVVFQVPSAINLSNFFYRVHPWRNDRFLEATSELRELFPNVDFMRINFNRHLLLQLHYVDPLKFETVRDELQAQWVVQMRQILSCLGHSIVLLWIRTTQDDGPLSAAPGLLARGMVDALRPAVRDIMEVSVPLAGEADELDRMIFDPLHAPVAAQLPGPGAHAQIARRLAEGLGR